VNSLWPNISSAFLAISSPASLDMRYGQV
jgi:hypothetical protein